MSEFFNLDFISIYEAIVRLFLALGFGLVIGWDRDTKNKPVDFRVYMIVCTATCILGILAQYLYFDLRHTDNFLNLDLAKIIAGALTGIGFLGAGAIIKRDEQQIVGSATGASIWASGIIGLCLGFGAYELAFLGFFSTAAILIVGGLFMPKFKDEKDKEKDKS